MGKVICIVNQKGGVGKTATAVNLGIAFAKAGKKVLIVDTDSQANVAKSLGIRDADTLAYTLTNCMSNVMAGKAADAADAIIRHDEGIDILLSNISLSGIELSLGNAISRELVLKRVLSEIRDNYEYIFLDCGPQLGLFILNALAASDYVLIPCEPSYLSATGMDDLFKTIATVRNLINPSLTILGILLTKVDYRTNNDKMLVESIRRGIGQSVCVFNTVIPLASQVKTAALEGVSVFETSSSGKAAPAYIDLAKEILNGF